MLPHRRIARALALASALAALAAPTTAVAGRPNDPVGSGAAAALAAAGQPGLATIAFEAATTSGDQYTHRMTGAFTATGPLADAGTLRTSYRFGDPRIDATATLIGARGIFTLSFRGAFGAIVADHQSGAGHWRVRGGTGAYRHLHGYGRWQAVAEFDAAPPGMLPPTIRGAFIGPLYRGLRARTAGSSPAQCALLTGRGFPAAVRRDDRRRPLKTASPAERSDF